MDYQNYQAALIKRRKRPPLKINGFILLFLILISVSFGAGMMMAQKNEIIKAASLKQADYAGKIVNKYVTAPNNKLTKDLDFKQFWEVWDLLKEKYVDKDKLDDKKMFYGALKGLVDSAGDPYTIYMEPKLAKEFSADLYKQNVYALPIVFPMVAKDKARIRTQLSAAHTRKHLDTALSAIEKTGKKLKVI